MTSYCFKEIIHFFGSKMGSKPPKEDIEAGEVEIQIDEMFILAKEVKGGFCLQNNLGLFLSPLSKERLKELCTSNFLGMNTGGCTFTLDEKGHALFLRIGFTKTTPPQECWEWLHRLIYISQEWNKVLRGWPEFIPLISLQKEEKHELPPYKKA